MVSHSLREGMPPTRHGEQASKRWRKLQQRDAGGVEGPEQSRNACQKKVDETASQSYLHITLKCTYASKAVEVRNSPLPPVNNCKGPMRIIAVDWNKPEIFGP